MTPPDRRARHPRRRTEPLGSAEPRSPNGASSVAEPPPRRRTRSPARASSAAGVPSAVKRRSPRPSGVRRCSKEPATRWSATSSSVALPGSDRHPSRRRVDRGARVHDENVTVVEKVGQVARGGVPNVVGVGHRTRAAAHHRARGHAPPAAREPRASGSTSRARRLPRASCPCPCLTRSAAVTPPPTPARRPQAQPPTQRTVHSADRPRARRRIPVPSPPGAGDR